MIGWRPRWGGLAVLLVSLVLAYGCHDTGLSRHPERLSDYGLFEDLAAQRPARGVIPYEINTPLFSDYAEKLRFVRLPRGESAVYRGAGPFDLPVGTILAKTFYTPEDERAPEGPRQLIETRLLVHEPDGWIGLPYVWNEQQSDAELRVTGAPLPVQWLDRQGAARAIEYRVPSVAECGLCHEAGDTGIAPIAVKAAQLNRALADGRNQLSAWSSGGLLVGLPSSTAEVPRYPVWNEPESGSLEDRARAYLDANCAHCHSPMGTASGSALDLRFEQREPLRYGVFRRPRAAGRGSGDLAYDIWPGRPDASILLHRMASVEPGVMMPELGRVTTHREGNQLIREWIASIEETAPPRM